MNDVVIFQEQRLTAAEIRSNVNLVQEVMQAVMQGPSKANPAGVHYGVIPGTPKPTLYKAGGEKLAQTFRLAPSYIVEDFSDADCARYRVTCRLTHQTTGTIMGDGLGSCSSMEEKYRWRKPVCNEEFNDTPEDRRREKWKKGYQSNPPYKEKQVRTERADIENTILKMASKRAFLAAILSATAASDIFTQDIEDLPEELRHDDEERPPQTPVQQPRAKSSTPQTEADRPISSPDAPSAGGAEPLSEGERNFIKRKLEEGALGEADVLRKFGKKIDDLLKADFQPVKTWIANPAE